jgi:hypothetical protein
MPCLDGWMVLDGGPRIRVECDFGSGWVNVTTWLRVVSIDRGRQGPGDRFDAGTCIVELENRDARFSTYSAIYGADRPVKSGNRLRVLGRSGGFTRAMFTGWVDSWAERGDTAEDLDAMVATAYDGWERLARAGVNPLSTPVGAGERGDQRVDRLLTAGHWSGIRSLQPTAVTMQGTTFGQAILNEIHDVALSESGEVYVDGTGALRLISKATITGTRPAVATLANDCTSGLPYVSIDMASNTDAIINTAYIACRAGSTRTAVDTGSVARFGERVFSATDLLHATDTQSSDAASFIVATRALADFCVEAVDLYPATGATAAERDDLWRLIASAELVDRLNIIFVPEHATENRASWLAPIDGLHFEATPAQARMSYRMAAIGTITAPSVISPPYNLHETTVTNHSIVWVWSNGSTYDTVLVKLSGRGYPTPVWQELPGGTTTWTASLVGADEDYTLCVKGRAGLVETDEVCDDAHTLAGLSGPGAAGCFDIPIPDNVLTCTETYTLNHVNDVSFVLEPVLTGTVPASAYGTCWRPTYAYVPGEVYQLQVVVHCPGVPDKVLDGTTFEEPGGGDWSTACAFPELLDPPTPLVQVEICGARSTVHDITTAAMLPLTRGPSFGVVVPGPYGTSTARGPMAVLVPSGGSPGLIVGPTPVADLDRLLQTDDAANTYNPVPPYDVHLHAGMTTVWWQKGGAVGVDWQTIWNMDDALRIDERFNAGVTQLRVVANVWDGSQVIDVFTGIIAGGNTSWHHIAVAYGWDSVGDIEHVRVWVDGVLINTLVLPDNWLLRDHGTTLKIGGHPGVTYAQWTTWPWVLNTAEVGDAAGPGPPITEWQAYVTSKSPVWYVPAVPTTTGGAPSGAALIDTIGLGSAAAVATTATGTGPFGESTFTRRVDVTPAPLPAVAIAQWQPGGSRTYQALVMSALATNGQITYMNHTIPGSQRESMELQHRTGVGAPYTSWRTLLYFASPSAGTYYVDQGVTLTVGTWYLMHLVIRATTIDCYINNTRATFPYDITAMTSTINGFVFGGQLNTNANGFCHVAIYDREFTNADVADAVTAFVSLS